MQSISEKQKRFCEEYLIDLNGKQAAIRAGYSPKSACEQACMMLVKPHIKAYLATMTGEKKMNLTITAERVLNELARLAFSDPAAYFKRDKNKKLVIKDIDELTEDQRAAVAEFDAKTKKLKIADKMPALDRLGRHLKLFTELHEQQHTFTIMPEVKIGGTTVIFNVGQPKPEKK